MFALVRSVWWDELVDPRRVAQTVRPLERLTLGTEVLDLQRVAVAT